MKNNIWLHKHTLGILQTAIALAILLSPAYVEAKPPGKGWKLTFSDDFNGKTLNPKKWSTCYWWASNGCTNGGNKELQWYQPDDVILRNGILRLRARKRQMNGFNYTSGMIASHDKYALRYGYVEMRAKLPKGRGLWPAFWLAPQQRNVWPPEIDVMEVLGHQPQRVNMSLHYKVGRDNKYFTASWDGPDFSAKYHTFALLWQPKRIIWYVDGVERQRYTEAANIPKNSMYILATLALGGAWTNTPPNATTPLPSYFDIDYIKVWQRN